MEGHPARKWILKAPYVTNSIHFKKYVKTVDQAMAALKTVCNNIYLGRGKFHCHEIPYMMLQQRVTDNGEVKLCFLNKRFSHILQGDGLKQSFKGYTQDDIILFAYHCLNSLSHLDNVFIIDGMVRVDLFKDDQGLLVLNELESLDATYFTTKEKQAFQTVQFLENYWIEKICENVLQHLE